MNLRYLLDRIYLVASLLMMSSAFVGHLVDLSNGASFSSGSAKMQLIWSAIYLVMLFRIVPHWRQIVDLLRANTAFTLFTFFSFLSIVWSDNPSISLRHSVGFILCTLFGVDIARRYTLAEQVSILTQTVWTAITISVVFQLFVPSMIISATAGDLGFSGTQDADAWIGIYHQKNIFGHVVALAAVLAVTKITLRKGNFFVQAGALVLCAVVATKAMSETPLVVTFTVALMLGCFLALRMRRRSLVTLGVATGLGGASLLGGLFLYKESIATMLGRESDLTGRTGIWSLVFESIGRNPILGHGFSAFWQVSYDSLRINQLLGWNVPSSHNTFIDITLETGIVGIALFFVTYWSALRNAISTLRAHSTPAARWPLAYLLMAAIYSFSESDLYTANSIYWVLFTSALISASRYAVPATVPRATRPLGYVTTAQPVAASL